MKENSKVPEIAIVLDFTGVETVRTPIHRYVEEQRNQIKSPEAKKKKKTKICGNYSKNSSFTNVFSDCYFEILKYIKD